MLLHSQFNRELVLRYFDLVFNQHNPASAAREFLSEDYRHYEHGNTHGASAFIDHFTKYFQQYPLFEVTVRMSIVEVDLVVLLVSTKLDQNTPFEDVAEFYRIRNKKISEHWHVIERTLASLNVNNSYW